MVIEEVEARDWLQDSGPTVEGSVPPTAFEPGAILGWPEVQEVLGGTVVIPGAVETPVAALGTLVTTLLVVLGESLATRVSHPHSCPAIFQSHHDFMSGAEVIVIVLGARKCDSEKKARVRVKVQGRL